MTPNQSPDKAEAAANPMVSDPAVEIEKFNKSVSARPLDITALSYRLALIQTAIPSDMSSWIFHLERAAHLLDTHLNLTDIARTVHFAIGVQVFSTDSGPKAWW
jgi:UDP-3-O-acyl-N-acetylglucosamine deacetylase